MHDFEEEAPKDGSVVAVLCAWISGKIRKNLEEISILLGGLGPYRGGQNKRSAQKRGAPERGHERTKE